LAEAPFEPLKSAEAKNLTLKVSFVLAITSLMRVGDLQALAIMPTCLEFAPAGVKAMLNPSLVRHGQWFFRPSILHLMGWPKRGDFTCSAQSDP